MTKWFPSILRGGLTAWVALCTATLGIFAGMQTLAAEKLTELGLSPGRVFWIVVFFTVSSQTAGALRTYIDTSFARHVDDLTATGQIVPPAVKTINVTTPIPTIQTSPQPKP